MKILIEEPIGNKLNKLKYSLTRVPKWSPILKLVYGSWANTSLCAGFNMKHSVSLYYFLSANKIAFVWVIIKKTSDGYEDAEQIYAIFKVCCCLGMYFDWLIEHVLKSQ